MRLILLLAVLFLGGCSGPAVSAADRATVSAFLAEDQAPLSTRIEDIWAGDHVLCGHMTTPARPGRAKRFIYRGGLRALNQVEKDASWSGAGDARGDEILYESQQIFASDWQDKCAANAPLSQRISGWFHSSGTSGPPDTPLTNSYADRALGEGRRP